MFNLQQLKLVLSLAIQGLETNKGRTILTTIGIVIGIATIVIVLSAGRGLERFINKEIEAFGSDTIEIEIKLPSVSDMEMASTMTGGAEVTTLKIEDFEAVKDLPNVDEYYAGIMGQFKSVYRNKTNTALILGVSASYPELDKEAVISEGRFYNDREDRSQSKVVVLGSKIKNDLFGTEDAVGKTIKINQVGFKVIGVLEERGSAFYMDFDDMIYVPLRTAQKQLLGIDHVLYGLISVHDTERTEETVADMINLMRMRHALPPDNPDKDDFRVTSMQEAMEIVGTITFGMTLLVVAVAAISLIVGGVGIMNIMYLSVLERTREIGLRKALGASNGIIEQQFLFEAIVITGIGGVAGIVIGYLIITLFDWIARLQGFDFELFITADAVILGIVSSLFFGIAFGLYPARKAAKLLPVDALRYE